jgi:hypothetical protein
MQDNQDAEAIRIKYKERTEEWKRNPAEGMGVCVWGRPILCVV